MMNNFLSVEEKIATFPAFLPSNYYNIFLNSVLFLFLSFLLYIILSYVVRPFVRRLDNTLALVVLGVSQTPLVLIAVLLSLRYSLGKLDSFIWIKWIERCLAAGIVVSLTYLIAQLFTQVASYYLRDYAKKTEAVWDDVLVPNLERVLPALTYILGAFLFLETIGIDLTGIWVAFGGLTFVLGFGVKDILANFFSGLILLIDTPFQYGDVISMSDGSTAVIKNIGLRVTKLYMIDKGCEIYIPNASLVNKDIVNLTRPTPHHATTIEVKVKLDADQDLAMQILRSSVFGHPDTLANPTDKLQYIDEYEGLKEAESDNLSKKEAGKLRLEAEQKVNEKLLTIENKFKYLIRAIKILEKGGLNSEQIQIVKKYYEEIMALVGVDVIKENQEIITNTTPKANTENQSDTLISSIINWYQAWLKDPDLNIKDERNLLDEMESKIGILQNKINRLYQKIANPGSYETRLDDYALELVEWLREGFRGSSDMWKEPTISLSNLDSDSFKFTVKFYIDNIKLENWSRSERIVNEVRREIVRRLKEANIYDN